RCCRSSGTYPSYKEATVRRTNLAIGLLALAGLLAIAGCGGGGSSTSNTSENSGGGEAETRRNTGGRARHRAGENSPEEDESASESESAAEPEGGAAPTTTTVAVVKVMNTPKLGKVIVDSEGMTLYDFHKDKGTTSACYGECAVAWPPLLTKGEP